MRPSVHPHGNSMACHVALGFANRIGAEMEDRGGKHGGSTALAHAFNEMIERADAARGDDRHGAPHRRWRASRRHRSLGRCRRDPSRSGVSRRRQAPRLRAQTLPHRGRSACLPPWVKISQRPGATDLASIATTMHWLPNFSAARRTKSRSSTAAVLIDTLSAPAKSNLRMSPVSRTPPPTVNGMKQASAVRLTTSKMMARFSWLAVMSRKHNSSAPAAS